MKDIPIIEPKEIITTITNMKTGEVYKDDNEWKAKNIPESDIRKDVRVIMPSLDLFGETK
jgi:membrane protein implicated in regulation of membrane protease activity